MTTRPTAAGPSVTGTALNPDRPRRQTTGFVNWQASLTWKPVPAATLYASVSTSSNPSGEQLDSTSDVYGGLGAGTVDLWLLLLAQPEVGDRGD